MTSFSDDRKGVSEFLNEKMGFNIDIDTDAAISEARDELYACSGNASLMIHEENADRADAVEYLMDVGLYAKERAEKLIEFITNPLFKAYVFIYVMGRELVRNALREVSPEIFYENQLCPSNLEYFRK